MQYTSLLGGRLSSTERQSEKLGESQEKLHVSENGSKKNLEHQHNVSSPCSQNFTDGGGEGDDVLNGTLRGRTNAQAHAHERGSLQF